MLRNIDDFPDEVAGFVTKYGDDVVRNIVRTLSDVGDDVVESLAKFSKIDVVAGAIGKAGWTPADVDKYVDKVSKLTPTSNFVTLFGGNRSRAS